MVLIYSLSGQLVPTWNHRVWDTLSFQNINPKPSLHTHSHTHTHKHMPAKAMSRLEPVCMNSILHTMFPCRNPFTVFSSSAPTVSEKQKQGNKISAFYNWQTAGSSEKGPSL